MSFRHQSAILALLYGLLLTFIAVSQGLHYGFHWGAYWRVMPAATALLGAMMVFSGKSALWVFITMGCVAFAEWQQLIFIAEGLLGGGWNFSIVDFWVFPVTFLPALAVLISLAALVVDAKIKPLPK